MKLRGIVPMGSKLEIEKFDGIVDFFTFQIQNAWAILVQQRVAKALNNHKTYFEA